MSLLLVTAPFSVSCSNPDAAIEYGDITTGQDFLTYEYQGSYDLIVTNPPFSLVIGLEFQKRALELRAPHGVVALLLRVNILGSLGRAAWLRTNTPSLYVTPRRPVFVGKHGDATEYGWFLWTDDPSHIVILDTEGPLENENHTFAKEKGTLLRFRMDFEKRQMNFPFRHALAAGERR